LSPVILVRRAKGQTANHPPCRSIDSAIPFSTGYQEIEIEKQTAFELELELDAAAIGFYTLNLEHG
jgi:hypothetical protein